jgi:preprotein translocase SecF subunit
VDYVGPRVGKELAEKAYLAMVLSLGGILIYITIRFRRLGFALGAILSLVHDGVIAAGIFNMWGGLFDLTTVAALLTLLGFSVNDTIVIFDRVRENMKLHRGTGYTQLFNDAVNQTLSRTLLTSLTVLLVVFSLFFFGGETLHGFSFLLLFGVIIGSYSTIFIASPLAIAWLHLVEKRGAKPKTAPSRPARDQGRQAAGR